LTDILLLGHNESASTTPTEIKEDIIIIAIQLALLLVLPLIAPDDDDPPLFSSSDEGAVEGLSVVSSPPGLTCSEGAGERDGCRLLDGWAVRVGADVGA
jgi:hypothetical protein